MFWFVAEASAGGKATVGDGAVVPEQHGQQRPHQGPESPRVRPRQCPTVQRTTQFTGGECAQVRVRPPVTEQRQTRDSRHREARLQLPPVPRPPQ